MRVTRRRSAQEPTQNRALMAALGRLVVRSSELYVGWALSRLCDATTMKHIERRMLRGKLEDLKSIAEQITGADEFTKPLARFCSHCISQFRQRNSPIHSTYLWDIRGFVKWDPKKGPEAVKAEDLEEAAEMFYGLAQKAVDYSLQLGDLREQGILVDSYVPASLSRRSCTLQIVSTP